jgi:uncharacterized protein
VLEGIRIVRKKSTKTKIEAFIKAILKSKHDDVREYFRDSGEANILFDSDQMTPLLSAVNGYDIEMIHILIDNGADVNLSNCFGYTPLMSASWRGATEIMKILIDNKADIRQYTSNDRYQAIHIAIEKSNKLEAVVLLINSGADVDVSTDYGSTPLQICAFVGGEFGIESAKLLITNGAKNTFNSNISEDWLSIAEKRRNTSFIDFINSL